jgi:PAS domain S-box-containing protein
MNREPNDPSQEPQPSLRQAVPASALRDGPINILIVDDEPKNLTVLETVLTDPSYRLVRAGSADQALLALVAEEFALLILDVQMPGMTGFELAQLVKERKKTAGVPIIFLTAYYNEDQHVLAGYNTGAVDYIHKPVNPIILRSKVAVFTELYRRNREIALANQALLAEVTERRRTQEQLRTLNETLEQQVVERTEALRHSEQLHRVAFDLAPIGMAYVGLDQRFSKVNRSMCEITGYTSDELTQMRVPDLTHPEDFDADVVRLDAFLFGRTPTYENEKRCVRKDGGIRWVALTARMVHDAEGRSLHSIWVIRDISDRKVAQERLLESEERFRLVADQTPVVMWVTDTAGRIEFVNAEYCKFFGTTLEQVRGAFWQPLVHPEDVAYLEAFDDSSRTRTSFHEEARVKRWDDEWRWVESCGAPRYSASNEYLGMVGTSHDVTGQKHAAELQQQTARQKDEFIAVLAHELRNPLAPIRTSVGILRARGTDDSLLVRCQDVIDRQAAHMARLLDDLLDISRLSRNTLALQRTRVLLADVIDAAVEISRPLIDAQRQQLIIEGLDQPIVLDADAVRLTQVFGNLLNNAAKYSNPETDIRVSVRHEEDDAVITVRDPGIGISAELIDRVFDMFMQAGGSHERALGGLGIGLSLARSLVEMHGGTISAASEGHGHGSAFTVRLPVSPADQRAIDGLDAGRMIDTSPLPRRVLVADDSVDGADMLATLLGALGCDVRAVYDGEAAIREAEQFRPDLLLLDIGMPGTNGYEACRRIRSQPWGSEVVMVALTGWGQEEDRRRSKAAGFDVHLVKPVDPAVLVQLVREMQPRIV